jgi:hypothetical protein
LIHGHCYVALTYAQEAADADHHRLHLSAAVHEQIVEGADLLVAAVVDAQAPQL